RLAAIHECDSAREFGVVSIAREQGAADRIQLGDHVHQRLVSQLAQQPFPIARHRKLARSARTVGNAQPGEFNGRVGGDKESKLTDDSVFRVLENAVSEAVSSDIWVRAACRKWRWRPESPGFLVADID